MSYLGDFKEDGDVYHKFSTRAFATGVPTTLAGSPVLSVYKDEGGAATEKTTAESYFDLDVDHDSIAGWHNVRIDLSGDAFFATGADYAVVITTGTVGGVNVFGENLFTFSIENRSMGQPAGATLAADIAALKAETALIVADTGTDGVVIAAAQTVATVTDVTNAVSLLTATQNSIDAIELDTGTTLSTDIAAVKAETALIVADTGTDGVVVAPAQTVATVTDVTNAVSLLTATQNSIDAIELDTGTTLSTDIAAVKAETALIVADTGTDGVVVAPAQTIATVTDVTNLHASAATAASQTTVAGLIAALDVVVDRIEVDTQDIQGRLPAALVNARMDATIDATGMEAGAVTNILTTQMTESYAANGIAPTLAQAQYAIHQMLQSFAIAGTTITVRELDNSTTAFIVTLDDATTPTTTSRA